MNERMRFLEIFEKPFPVGDLAIAFSGGIDSSLVAFFASKKAHAKLYTVGIPGCHDFSSAEKSSMILGLKLNKIKIDNIEKEVKELSDIINVKNRFVLSYTLPFYFVVKFCSEKTVANGTGADELFGGYYKYLHSINPESEMKKDYEKIIKNDYERIICDNFGKTLVRPFLNKEIVDFAFSMPIDFKIKNGIRKYILREAAKMVLPEEIAEKPKKAAQYGSGLLNLIRKG